MVSADKIRRGVERYVNEEFIANTSGWRQFAAGTALGVLLPKISSDIDIETMYQAASDQMSKQPDGITITREDMQAMHPTAGTLIGALISSVTFRQSDLDKLYRYIMEG